MVSVSRSLGRPLSALWAWLISHRAQIDEGSVGEMIEDLFRSPPPGMMFADELASGLHRALIVRIASILVEALG